jgi:DNA ligase-associated metallophosphoesterase
MKGMKPYTIAGETLWLTPQRAIFWEAEKAILVSDCHMGKTGHFRKEGIAVPQDVYKEDLRRLVHLVQFFHAEQLIVVGDLFHSRSNRELDLFQKWRLDLPGLSVHLVRGNHDILEESWYIQAGITLHEGTLHRRTFSFTHHPPEERPGNTLPDVSSAGPAAGERYLFTGHLHPSVTMRGAGKQTLRFPCYYFGKSYAILPAFGQFTGTARVDAQPGDHLFAIVNQEIIHLS